MLLEVRELARVEEGAMAHRAGFHPDDAIEPRRPSEPSGPHRSGRTPSLERRASPPATWAPCRWPRTQPAPSALRLPERQTRGPHTGHSDLLQCLRTEPLPFGPDTWGIPWSKPFSGIRLTTCASAAGSRAGACTNCRSASSSRDEGPRAEPGTYSARQLHARVRHRRVARNSRISMLNRQLASRYDLQTSRRRGRRELLAV